MRNNGAVYQVQVTLSRATELLVADATGTSDPYVVFRISGQTARSTVLMKTLDPVWSPPEQFEIRVINPSDKVLEVEVFDFDWLSADDTLGKVQIPLAPFINSKRNDHAPEERGYKLEVPKTWFRKTPNSSVYLAISVMPVDEADCVLELWENEYWTPSGGWQPASEGVMVKRGRWSNDDGSVSGDSFEKVMPRVPDTHEGSDWNFTVQNGDVHGWVYAASFAGPWCATTNKLAVVRRRRWINKCRPRNAPAPRNSIAF
ncbi:hypothetical protein PINS_up002789 [Pythium insidiosum]|nr:hypothetical protein PINS_up002789 [Pythium insidiosum]